MTALQSIVNRKHISPPYIQMECLISSFVLYIQHMQKTVFTCMPKYTSNRTNRFYIAGVLFDKTPIQPIRCHVDYQCSHALPNINRKFISDVWATFLAFVWPNVFVTKYFFVIPMKQKFQYLVLMLLEKFSFYTKVFYILHLPSP